MVFGCHTLVPAEAEDITDNEFQYEILADSDLNERLPDTLPGQDQHLESYEEQTVEKTQVHYPPSVGSLSLFSN